MSSWQLWLPERCNLAQIGKAGEETCGDLFQLKTAGWGWWGSNPSLTRSFLQVDLDCSIHPKLGLCRLSFAAELRLPQSWSEREQRSVWWGAASWSACNTVEGQDTTFWYIMIILDEYWLAVSNNPFTFYPFNLDDDPSPSWLWEPNQQPGQKSNEVMIWNALKC